VGSGIMADNLTYNSIVTNIRESKINNLYLFYGSESLLIKDAMNRIEKKILNPSLKDMNFIKFEGSVSAIDSIITACETLPFMDNKKIVIVSGGDFFKGRKGQAEGNMGDKSMDILFEYLSRLPQTVVLIFTAGSEVDKRKKLYTIIKKYGEVIEFGSLKNQELLSWVIKSFEKNGKAVGRAEASYFCENVSGSLEDMLNEINKACAYSGDRPAVSRSDIDAVISKSLEINVFKLVDFVSEKKPGMALNLLNDLLLDSQPVPVIFAMIIRQFRLLLNVKLLSAKGYSVPEISNKLGIMPFVSKNLLRIAGYYTGEQIENKLRRCLDVDELIKNGRMEQRIAVESLIIEFAQ
jgi:DNA polymerase III, delta subunit